MLKRRGLLLGLTALAVTAIVGAMPRTVRAQEAPATPKKRLAVLEFEYSTVTHWWGSDDWNVGRGISDLLVNDLLKDGTFSMIERRKLDDVLKEQQLSNSSVADPRTATQLGKVLGVNALVTGSVTQFGFDDKSVGLNGIGSNFAGGLFGGVKHKESKAVVVVTARLIDPSTGEILASAEGKGESKRGSWGGFGGGWGHSGFGGGGIDMSSSNFQNTILGEATRKCVEALTTQLVAQQPKIGYTKITISGKVADVEGSTVILNIGKDAGVNVGDTLSVERLIRVVKDPDSGKVIREVTQPVGVVRITQADATSATGTFSGSGTPKVGDRIKSR